MDGPWLFRFDNGNGLAQRVRRTRRRPAGPPTTVPYAWNVGDSSVASFNGAVGWYRKDFLLPIGRRRPQLDRALRVGQLRRAGVHQRPPDRRAHREFLPWELLLPARYLSRTGTNRLVVRVDSHHFDDSLPPNNGQGSNQPSGGWWNYGGILREVYLREVNRVDLTTVRVLPVLQLPLVRRARAVLRAWSPTTTPAAGRSRHRPLRRAAAPALGTQTIAPGKAVDVHRQRRRRASAPVGPGHPTLYPVALDATVGAAPRWPTTSCRAGSACCR